MFSLLIDRVRTPMNSCSVAASARAAEVSAPASGAFGALLMLIVSVSAGCAGAPPAADPKETDARHNELVEQMALHQYSAAEVHLKALASDRPAEAGAHLNLAILYVNTDRLQEAEAALQEALRLDRQAFQAHNQLGIVYRRTGRFGEAEQAYLRALEVASDYGKAHFNLGVLYDLYLRTPERALHHYERYLALGGEDSAQVQKWVVDLRRQSARTLAQEAR